MLKFLVKCIWKASKGSTPGIQSCPPSRMHPPPPAHLSLWGHFLDPLWGRCYSACCHDDSQTGRSSGLTQALHYLLAFRGCRYSPRGWGGGVMTDTQGQNSLCCFRNQSQPPFLSPLPVALKIATGVTGSQVHATPITYTPGLHHPPSRSPPQYHSHSEQATLTRTDAVQWLLWYRQCHTPGESMLACDGLKVALANTGVFCWAWQVRVKASLILLCTSGS